MISKQINKFGELLSSIFEKENKEIFFHGTIKTILFLKTDTFTSPKNTRGISIDPAWFQILCKCALRIVENEMSFIISPKQFGFLVGRNSGIAKFSLSFQAQN